MRELKFRAWDESNKDMFQVYSLGDNLLNGCLNFYSAGKEFLLMQYIGLHDKNGQEIYEGDIQLLDYGRGKRIAVVEWDMGSASFVYHTKPDGFCHACREVDARANQVIGNIYENPELLEAK